MGAAASKPSAADWHPACCSRGGDASVDGGPGSTPGKTGSQAMSLGCDAAAAAARLSGAGEDVRSPTESVAAREASAGWVMPLAAGTGCSATPADAAAAAAAAAISSGPRPWMILAQTDGGVSCCWAASAAALLPFWGAAPFASGGAAPVGGCVMCCGRAKSVGCAPSASACWGGSGKGASLRTRGGFRPCSSSAHVLSEPCCDGCHGDGTCTWDGTSTREGAAQPGRWGLRTFQS